MGGTTINNGIATALEKIVVNAEGAISADGDISASGVISAGSFTAIGSMTCDSLYAASTPLVSSKSILMRGQAKIY